MSKRDVSLYLQDILNSAEKIEEYIKGSTFESFKDDWKTIDAVVRNLEIIGEAARNIPEDFATLHPDVPWGKMVSMRNKVIHEYIGVDEEILWKTIKEDLPPLKKQIEVLLTAI